MDIAFLAALAGIIWLDLILSVDNAVVIALVSNGVEESKRNTAVVLGTVLAVAMRVVGAFFATKIMSVWGLSLAAGLYLSWVAFSLASGGGGHKTHKPATTLGAAIFAIAVADFGMSIDNVVAVAGMAHGNTTLMAIGIAVSIPLMVVGAKVIGRFVKRYPILEWAGAALLAWVAGGVMLHDPLIPLLFTDYERVDVLGWFVPAFALLAVITTALAFRVDAVEA